LKSTIAFIVFFFTFSVVAQDAGQSGKASFYHDSFHGQETSNGESYNKNDFTAAHRTLPFGTILLVTNKNNRKSVIVRVNDRGPFAKSRIIDLSYAAASKIGMVPFGVVPVRVTILNKLDRIPVTDMTFLDGEIWDCTVQKRVLSQQTIFIWKTENWKHAFYMASNLSVEYGIDVLVQVAKKNNHTDYSLLITNLNDQDFRKWRAKLKVDGFLAVRIKN
jgi:rare lipoprotein A